MSTVECVQVQYFKSIHVNSLTGSPQNAYLDQYNLKRTVIFTGY